MSPRAAVTQEGLEDLWSRWVRVLRSISRASRATSATSFEQTKSSPKAICGKCIVLGPTAPSSFTASTWCWPSATAPTSRAIEFRRWATDDLTRYLLEGEWPPERAEEACRAQSPAGRARAREIGRANV